jgi:ubiquinone/menaquinone biosynthesis C-methylase UbiE
MDIDEYYENHYEEVINSGIVGRFSSQYHRLMERDFQKHRFGNILEVGAGKGQHLHFVKCQFDKYFQTDIRVNSENAPAPDSKTFWIKADAQDLSQFSDGLFERTIATCLIAHLSNPEKALREWRRVTSKIGGVVSIYRPCEPSFLLRLAQSLSTRRKATKIGVDYLTMHYREHRNHYFYVKALINEIFQNDQVKVIGFPFRFLPFDLKLYEIYQIELVDKGGTTNE